MKKIGSIIIVVVVFLSMAIGVSAKQMAGDQTVILPEGQTIKGNHFMAGERVKVRGTVEGDLYVFGGEVELTGTVGGDVLVAGGEVEIRGKVAQDVRVVGGEVIIEGTVMGNITALGGEVFVLSEVGRGIVAGGGLVKIGGPVAESVIIGASDVVVNTNAQIAGDLVYYSDKPANVQHGAQILGKTKYHAPQSRADQATDPARILDTAFLMYKLIGFLSAFLIGYLILKLAPRYLRATGTHLANRPWKTLGVGFVIVFLTPVFSLILAISVVGIPLAVFVIIMWVVAIYIAKIFVWYYLGERIIRYKANDTVRASASGLFVGLLIYFLLTLTSIGWMVSLLTVFFGIGAYALQKKALFDILNKNKLI